MEFLGQNEFVIWRNRLRNIRNKLPSSYHIPCLFIDQLTFLSPCGQPILNNLNHPLKLHVSHSSFQLHSHFAYVIVCTVNDQFTQPSYMKMNSSCESVLCIVLYCLPSHRTLSSSIPFQTCYLTVSSSNPLTVFRTSSQPHSRDNANSAVANSIRSRQNDDITQPTTKRFIVSYCRHIWCLFLLAVREYRHDRLWCVRAQRRFEWKRRHDPFSPTKKNKKRVVGPEYAWRVPWTSLFFFSAEAAVSWAHVHESTNPVPSGHIFGIMMVDGYVSNANVDRPQFVYSTRLVTGDVCCCSITPYACCHYLPYAKVTYPLCIYFIFVPDSGYASMPDGIQTRESWAQGRVDDVERMLTNIHYTHP